MVLMVAVFPAILERSLVNVLTLMLVYLIPAVQAVLIVLMLISQFLSLSLPMAFTQLLAILVGLIVTVMPALLVLYLVPQVSG